MTHSMDRWELDDATLFGWMRPRVHRKLMVKRSVFELQGKSGAQRAHHEDDHEK